jgi:hypothetical protein
MLFRSLSAAFHSFSSKPRFAALFRLVLTITSFGLPAPSSVAALGLSPVVYPSSIRECRSECFKVLGIRSNRKNRTNSSKASLSCIARDATAPD